jgi:hypothetical protein
MGPLLNLARDVVSQQWRLSDRCHTLIPTNEQRQGVYLTVATLRSHKKNKDRPVKLELSLGQQSVALKRGFYWRVERSLATLCQYKSSQCWRVSTCQYRDGSADRCLSRSPSLSFQASTKMLQINKKIFFREEPHHSATRQKKLQINSKKSFLGRNPTGQPPIRRKSQIFFAWSREAPRLPWFNLVTSPLARRHLYNYTTHSYVSICSFNSTHIILYTECKSVF